MRNVIWPVLISTVLHSGFSYLWLMVANSGSPVPGKGIILGCYLLIVFTFLWRFKTVKEIGLFSLLAGFLGGVTSSVIAGAYFPGAFHEMDFQSNMLSIFLNGSLILIGLYSILALGVFCFKKLFKSSKHH
ncbi:MAG: hypothetical protein IPK79_08365 [Vampirovibrionales bacterium]|nr:hypothetical protein [Vampirovibrionales bacterium]